MSAKSNRVGVVATNSTDFVRILLDCLASKQVVVPLRSTDDEYRIEVAEVGEVITPEPGTGWMNNRYTPTDDDSVAQVMFTSGTEGEPKGIELTHAALADVVQRLNTIMEVDDSIREYIGVPVHHSFGYGRCRAVAAVGGSAYLPEHGFNPSEIAEMLARGEINALSAVPSLIRVLLAEKAIFGDEAAKLRWMEIGSQAMSRAEKEEIKALFPNAVIVQHYGLTEASRTTFLEIHKVEGEHLDSVGRAYGRTKVRIADNGRVQVSGPHVTSTILKRGESWDPRDEDGWLETSDNGEIRDGFVYYMGRADDVINCGGIKLSPDSLEASIRKRTGVSTPMAVCRIPDPMRGEGILLAITSDCPVDRATLLQAAIDTCADYSVNARNAIRLYEADQLPATATGKIQRKQLAKEFAESAQTHETTAVSSTDRDGFVAAESAAEKDLAKIWEDAIGISPIGVTETFFDLGGDSLSAIKVLVRMERAGIDENISKSILRGATIREVVASQSGDETIEKTKDGWGHLVDNGSAQANLLTSCIRGLLVLAVVIGHWSGFVTDRLPESMAWVQPVLAPFFGLGTMGFAILFGVGLGNIHLPSVNSHPERVRQATRTGMLLVGIGIAVRATLTIAAALLDGDTFGATMFFNAFYSVLLFYFLALASVPYLLAGIARFDDPIKAALIFSAASFGMHHVVHLLLDPIHVEGLAQLARLSLVAKYAYFNLFGGVLFGLAVGAHIHKTQNTIDGRVHYRTVGTTLVATGMVLAIFYGELPQLFSWPSANMSLWRWVFSLGVVVTGLHMIGQLIKKGDDVSLWLRRPLNLAAVLGQLALPVFVGHEAVQHTKHVLVGVGMAPGLALAGVMGIFLAVMYMSMRRVHTLYYV